MVYDTTIAIPENPLLLTSQNYYYNIKHNVSLSNSRQHTDFSNKLQTKTYTEGKSKYPLHLINLKWAGHYYGCLPVCLLANLPSPHKFAAALFQRCNSRVTKQRMFWQVHCNFNGVDAPKKERRAENYASSFGQSVIYAIMHCTMQPPLSRHNPLFLQLCMAGWNFSPGCQFLLRIPLARQKKLAPKKN